MATPTWYVLVDGRPAGPLSSRELLDLVARGRVTRATPVGRSAAGPWRPAERVRNLFPAAEARGPAPEEPEGEAEPPVAKAPEGTGATTPGILRRVGRIAARVAVYGLLAFIGLIGLLAYLGREPRQDPGDVARTDPAPSTPASAAPAPPAPANDEAARREAEALAKLEAMKARIREQEKRELEFLVNFGKQTEAVTAQLRASREAEERAEAERRARAQDSQARAIGALVGAALGLGGGDDVVDGRSAEQRRYDDEMDARMRQERFDRDMERYRNESGGP